MNLEKNRGAVGGLANQSAAFQKWTNQKAVFGSRDRLGRESIFWVLEPSLSGSSMRGRNGNDVIGGNDDRDRK